MSLCGASICLMVVVLLCCHNEGQLVAGSSAYALMLMVLLRCQVLPAVLFSGRPPAATTIKALLQAGARADSC
jgi:hypothetical protein